MTKEVFKTFPVHIKGKRNPLFTLACLHMTPGNVPARFVAESSLYQAPRPGWSVTAPHIRLGTLPFLIWGLHIEMGDPSYYSRARCA